MNSDLPTTPDNAELTSCAVTETTSVDRLALRGEGGTDELTAGSRTRPWFQILTAVACFTFGIALIVNTQLANDGGWFWYAVLHHGGKHLYSDLHFVLQPLAVLETEWWMCLAGKGWALSRVPALLHLLAFVTGITLLSAESTWTDLQKAVVLACTFFVGIHFEHYRFDDYHVMFHVCFLFSIVLLLKLTSGEGAKRNQKIAALLGILSGLAVTTRLTDGGVLLISAAFALAYIADEGRLKLLTWFFVPAAVVIATAISVTGDSFRDYAAYTILGAAAPKGGVTNVLLRPFLLVQNSLVFLSIAGNLFVIALCGTLAASWTFLLSRFSKSDLPGSSLKAVVGLALSALSLAFLIGPLMSGHLIVVLSAVWVLAAYCCALRAGYLLVCRLLRNRGTSFCQKHVLLLLPFGLLVSGSMSSFGYHYGLYAPIAFFILILPIVFTTLFAKSWLKSCFMVVAGLMALSGAYFKANYPVAWNNYQTFPMFVERSVVKHPTYGPMVIDKDMDSFFSRICSTIAGEERPELLSIPFPYANYYCDIPPWEGFVQTFFDTSGKNIIDDMISKLQHRPPRWVLYQRQLNVLAQHERALNNGNRLPHHDLDDFIVDKITAGQWHLVGRGEYGTGNDWLLIRTN